MTRGGSSGTGATDPPRPGPLAHHHGPRGRGRDGAGADARARRAGLARAPGGQHLDLRLTADDGYQAQRSYSIASSPEAATLEITVEMIDDGEVSPYLVEEVRPGDELEVRGPIGGHFTWSVADGGPVLLVAGGRGWCR